MTVSADQVQSAVLAVIDELNASASPDRQIGKTSDTTLYGAGSVLDSLGLVNLIIAIEGRIGEEFGVAVTLADEKAMSMRNSPFRTVGTICDYVHGLIREQAGT